MSIQDTEKCSKCGALCGYDNDKVSWQGFILCHQCKGNLLRRFCAFWGLVGIASTNSGIEVEWQDVDKILSKIKRDYNLRISYIVTDLEEYERQRMELVSILES